MGLSQDLMAPKHFEGWMIKVEFAQVQTGCPPTTGNRVFTKTQHMTGFN